MLFCLTILTLTALFSQKPPIVPICTECLGTEAANPAGEAERLVSCHGCGQSVHPSCRVSQGCFSSNYD